MSQGEKINKVDKRHQKPIFLCFLKDMRYHIFAVPLLFLLLCFVMYFQEVSFEKLWYPFFMVLLFNLCYLVLKYIEYSKLIRLLRSFNSENVEVPELLGSNSELFKLYIENIEKNTLFFGTQMRKKNDELQEIKDNISLWAHQIKTPLTALKIELKDDKNRLFEINEYVNSLMQIVRLDGGGRDFVFERLSLIELIKGELRYFAPLFISKGLNLELKLDEGLMITSDKKWLSFVLRQLLSNAIKYTKKGSIRLYTAGDELVVEDSGIGILSEDIPRLFERTYTGENGRIDMNASGLGLYLSKKVLKMLNMDIRIESQVAKGTKIFISLQNCKIS